MSVRTAAGVGAAIAALVISSTLVGAAGPVGARSGTLLPDHDYAPSEVLVLVSPDADGDGVVTAGETLAGVETAVRGQVAQRYALSRGREVWRVKLDDGKSVRDALAERWSAADTRIRVVEPNYRVHADHIPNDPHFPEMWGLRNTGTGGGVADADVDAPEAWSITTGDDAVIVAVIDSGIDYLHPDLVDRMWVNEDEIPDNGVDDDANGYVDDVNGYDFVQDDADPTDVAGHGTHVAGTIAAHGNNGIGVAGLDWRCRVMACRFLDASGSGWTADAVAAIEYAVTNGARILNNSWGGGSFSAVLRAEIEWAGEQDVLFVAAAGNWVGNTDVAPHYPSSYDLDNIISVAATDNRDQLAVFSGYGPQTVDLGAPGDNILSTVPEFQELFFEDFQGAEVPGFAGTSMTLEGPVNRWGTVVNDIDFSGNKAASADWANAFPYLGGSNGSIVTPPMNTQGLRGLFVMFYLRVDTGYNDALWLDVWDGASWRPLAGYSAWGLFYDFYFYTVVEVPQDAQGPDTRFRWRWVTDSTDNDYQGFEVDDILVGYSSDTYVDPYAYNGGTSMATPHVSGVAALVLAEYPKLSVYNLKQRVIWTGDSKPALAGRTLSGRRLNAYAALTTPAELSVVAPNEADTWAIGSEHLILWRSFGGNPQVDVDLVRDGEVITRLADGAPNTGEFVWQIAPELLPGDGYRIRVSDGVHVDESDEDLMLVRLDTYYLEDFEDGPGGFAFDNAYGAGHGLWHLSSACASASGDHSTPTSLYYGQDATCDYDAGLTEGVVTSPVIDLTTIAPPIELSFQYYLETEGFSQFYDVVEVTVSANEGVFQLVASNDPSHAGITLADPSGTWRTATIDLSALAGSQIRLRFRFDTGNGTSNSYAGLYVDDLLVMGRIDCNSNGVADNLDISSGTSSDLNSNGIPDECDDCNMNGVYDGFDLAAGTSNDCNANETPDECDPDCNGNGTPDDCDVAAGTSPDTNSNGTPDDCELIYVDDSATNGLDIGTSWDNAYLELSDALDRAAATNVVREIWVAEGVYVPYQPPATPSVGTFHLIDGVSLYGGFGGWETNRSERDPTGHPTVLEGLGPAQNVRRVVTAENLHTDTLLDGFTIQHGWAQIEREYGAGLGALNSKLTVRNCRFDTNRADQAGAGAFLDNAEVLFSDCTFVSNKAGVDGAGIYATGGLLEVQQCRFTTNQSTEGDGGGIKAIDAEVSIRSSVFERNIVGNFGGGVHSAANCRIEGCVFVGNRAINGGGIYHTGYVLVMVNSVFSGNRALYVGAESYGNGGGLCGNDTLDLPLTNCSFSGNTASRRGGATYSKAHARFAMTNCVLAGNVDADGSRPTSQLYSEGPSPIINYCCMANLSSMWPGTGNVDVPPRFRDPQGVDQMPGTVDDDLRLSAGSPCIDAGSNDADVNGPAPGIEALPASDADGLVRLVDDPVAANAGNPPGAGAIVDIGAYEYQYDCNTNGVVDSLDLDNGASADCNDNGIPDECDVAVGRSVDCNVDLVPDECAVIGQPVDVTICPDEEAVFATQAAAPQFGYQWKEGGVPLIDGGRISGATTDTLHIANVEPADHGRLFTCEILDGCVLDETRAAKLNVVILPTITTQPQALVRVCAGEGVGFSVTVSGGNSVPDYQWYADGVALENGDKYYGVRTKSMWINDADYVDEGVAFTCVVSNECQSVESAAAMLEVATPRIVAEPQDACADIGETIVLTVEAESAATVFYQWRKDGASVGSGPTLTLSNVQRQDAGDYKALVFSVNPTCIAETRAAIVQVGSCPTCLTPGDSDGDGDIDLADMQWFMLCAGQSVLSHPECACANAAADDWMVQDADWSAMSAVVTGPQ